MPADIDLIRHALYNCNDSERAKWAWKYGPELLEEMTDKHPEFQNEQPHD